MFWLKIFTLELVNLKAAFVDIEMNISFLKIGRAGFPSNRFGMKCFYRLPCTITNTFAMRFGFNEQYFQFIMVCFIVDTQDYSAHIFSIKNDAVGLALRIVNAAFNRIAGDDFTIIVNMIISFTNDDR